MSDSTNAETNKMVISPATGDNMVKESVTSTTYASKADPAVKQVIIAYDDKEGRPTSNDDIW